MRAFLDRNNIGLDKVKHFGWYGNSLENHINHLEQAEIKQSKVRSKITVPVQQVASPKIPQQQPSIPHQQSFNIPVTPVKECTQGELGLENGENYKDKFDEELATLKQDIAKTENDPKMSNLVPEMKRKEAIDSNQLDQAFLRALQDISANATLKETNPQNNTALPGQIGKDEFKHFAEKTDIFPSGFNPNPIYQGPSQPQQTGGFNMSGFGQQNTAFDMSALHQKQISRLDDQKDPVAGIRVSDSPNTNPFHQDPRTSGLNQIPGWAPAGQQAFTSMMHVNDQPILQVPVIPGGMPASKDQVIPKLPETPEQFGSRSKLSSPIQAKPKLADSDFIQLIRRVGI